MCKHVVILHYNHLNKQCTTLNGNKTVERALPEAILMDEVPVITMAPRALALVA